MREDKVKRIIKRKRLELLIAGLGYLIGIGLGVWVTIKLIWINISK